MKNMKQLGISLIFMSTLCGQTTTPTTPLPVCWTAPGLFNPHYDETAVLSKAGTILCVPSSGRPLYNPLDTYPDESLCDLFPEMCADVDVPPATPSKVRRGKGKENDHS